MGTKMRMLPDGKVFEVGNEAAVKAALAVGYVIVEEKPAPEPPQVRHSTVPPEPIRGRK